MKFPPQVRWIVPYVYIVPTSKSTVVFFARSGNFHFFLGPGFESYLIMPVSINRPRQRIPLHWQGAIFRPRLPSNGDLPSYYGRTRPPCQNGSRMWTNQPMSLAEVPSNGDLPSNYGRTSPPAKTVLACEPINLCLWTRLPSNGNLPSSYGRTRPPAKTVLA